MCVSVCVGPMMRSVSLGPGRGTGGGAGSFQREKGDRSGSLLPTDTPRRRHHHAYHLLHTHTFRCADTVHTSAYTTARQNPKKYNLHSSNLISLYKTNLINTHRYTHSTYTQVSALFTALFLVIPQVALH